MTIRERIIGWCGGDPAMADRLAVAESDRDTALAELEECHEARRTAVANYEMSYAERTNLSRRLDAVRRALTD